MEPHGLSFNSHTLVCMKNTEGASAVCKSARSWGCFFCKFPPLQTSTAVSLSVKIFRNDHADGIGRRCGHTSFHPKLWIRPCSVDVAAACVSIAAISVRWLPRWLGGRQGLPPPQAPAVKGTRMQPTISHSLNKASSQSEHPPWKPLCSNLSSSYRRPPSWSTLTRTTNWSPTTTVHLL